jgi:hypothetical protein
MASYECRVTLEPGTELGFSSVAAARTSIACSGMFSLAVRRALNAVLAADQARAERYTVDDWPKYSNSFDITVLAVHDATSAKALAGLVADTLARMPSSKVAGWWKLVWRREDDRTIFTAWFTEQEGVTPSFGALAIANAFVELQTPPTVAVNGLSKKMHALAVRAATAAEDDATARVSQYYGWLRVAVGGATLHIRYFHTQGCDYALTVQHSERQSDEVVGRCARFIASRVVLTPGRGTWRFSWVRESDCSFTVLARFKSEVPDHAIETPLIRVDLSSTMSAASIFERLNNCPRLLPLELRSAAGVGIAAVSMAEVRRLEVDATPFVL